MNVITLVHGRRRQLANLVAGLERSRPRPDGLWVVFMDEPAEYLSARRFPLHVRQVEGDGRGLPLARARNQVREAGAPGPWVFLDVDCIPDDGLLKTYAEVLRRHPEALHLGEVRYLPPQATAPGWRLDDLRQAAVAHPLSRHRGAPGDLLPHHLFWSLNFACTAEVFEQVGGFDEGYEGYGAEDTDFAFRARQRGVAVRGAAALAFHQYHPTYRPPLNHFAAIVANARRFQARWDVWPMQDWLGSFAERGLVEWTEKRLAVRRAPTDEEVRACFNEARMGF